MGYREASTSFTETVAFLGLRNEAQSRRQEKGEGVNPTLGANDFS